MNWSPGPFSIKGEFMHLQDERRSQGLLSQDLPDLISRGWYLSSHLGCNRREEDRGY